MFIEIYAELPYPFFWFVNTFVRGPVPNQVTCAPNRTGLNKYL